VVEAAARQDGGDLLARLSADEDWSVRLRVARILAGRDEGGEIRTRLQFDEHPFVRAVALTPGRAAELVRDPERETSWHVLSAAARLAKEPLWRLEPQHPWQPPRVAPAAGPPVSVCRPEPPHARPLGSNGSRVAPLGVSGHYGLPVAGFVQALEAGVNLLFWEPAYQTLTRFASQLPASERRGLHWVAGTFEADGRRVRRDAEQALRTLGLDRLAVFLVFWVRSWARLAPDVLPELARLKEQGKVESWGLSTHSRALAVEAMAAGWDPVMVRHSAAHRGAERDVFPHAQAAGRGLLTFSCTCYGRLLRPRAGLPPPSAADCYRYTLEQPGVAACFSAPATVEQLDENLTALRDPVLPDGRRAALLAQGAAVYADERVFRRLVRER
jgi:hypothetical protein